MATVLAKSTYARDVVQNIAPQVRVGDIFAFGGKTAFARLIKHFTRSSVSHCGIVVEEGGQLQLLESTIHLKHSGVRLTPILDAVAQYNGDAWWLPISDRVRNSLDKTRFHQFVLDYQRTKFDLLGSIRAAEIIIPMLHLNKRLKIIYQEDLSKLFCSELICAAFREAGAIQSINASEVTPADLCMFSVYSGQYFQLKDDRDKALNGYNSQNPEGFGVVR